jgi:sulfate adenylyltransferase subunit 2
MNIMLNDMEELITPAPGVVVKTEPVAIRRPVARHFGHLDALESEAIHIMREWCYVPRIRAVIHSSQ